MTKTEKKPIIGITMDYQVAETYARFPWYALRSNYAESVSHFGATPIMLPNNTASINHYLDLIDGLIVTGGDFDIDPKLYDEEEIHPETKINSFRTDFEMDLLKKAIDRENIAILGICAGEQLLNVIFGGTLYQHIPDQVANSINHTQPHPKNVPYHNIKLEKDSKLMYITGKENFRVNSTHHQAVKKPGNGLKVSAVADDGVIEAIELENHRFCIGVEWHPEYLSTEEDKILMESFVRAARGE